jgi:two-component system sensor histidine kinase KdpD
MLTFGVMLAVGLVIGTLTARVRRQALAAELRERRTSVLYGLTGDLAAGRTTAEIANTAVRHLSVTASSPVSILLPNEAGELRPVGPLADFFDERERGVAEWAFEHEQPAGATTDTLSAAKALYLPLRASAHTLGLLAIRVDAESPSHDAEQMQLIDTLSRQTAMALERASLAEAAEQNRRRAEREELRSTLLSSVSHDLRTPLGAITGAASTLLSQRDGSPEQRSELLETIYEEANRLNRMVSNLLDMTRLESGTLVLHKEWTPLEEVVGAALNRIDAQLAGRSVGTDLPKDLPLVPLDGALMEQVFFNLLENAAKYTPQGSPIDISARLDGNAVVVDVADRGPGFAPGSEQRLFDKFYRERGTRAAGTGLGLAICRGIMIAHGGSIAAENRSGGGALFRIRIPLTGAAPVLERELDASAPARDELQGSAP